MLLVSVWPDHHRVHRHPPPRPAQPQHPAGPGGGGGPAPWDTCNHPNTAWPAEGVTWNPGGPSARARLQRRQEGVGVRLWLEQWHRGLLPFIHRGRLLSQHPGLKIILLPSLNMYVKSMTSSTIQHLNCVNHISNKGCDNLERHQKYYSRCRCLYQNKFYVLQHVKWFYEFTSQCETCDWFLASAGHQR